MLWRLWKSRKLLIFQQKSIVWRNIIQQARYDANEWKTQSKAQQMSPLTSRQQPETNQKKWSRPQNDWIKCNADGSFLNSNIPNTAGWILRD